MFDSNDEHGNKELKRAKDWFVQAWVKSSEDTYSENDKVFEIGLSLGGTVSAGAFTAGALDFLIEALEEWEQQKAREKDLSEDKRTVPWHKVRIKVISGASGGGVCAASLAKALAYPFPHVAHSSNTPPQSGMVPFVPPPDADQNPFYRLWVSNFDIEGFCENSDSESNQKEISSLLNPAPLLRGCDIVASYPEPPKIAPLPEPRPYIAEPLTLLLTLSNLTGIPYRTAYSSASERYQMYRKHADYVRFEVYFRDYSEKKNWTFPSSWPDAFCVTERPVASMPHTERGRFVTWTRVAEFARATGAFPVGFPAVKLQRPAWHYLYQPIMKPDDSPGRPLKATVAPPAWGAWGQHPTSDYTFICVDGGAFNNQPGELARRHLAGMEGSNPRDEKKACRAVIVIDPFADEIGRGPQEIPSVTQGAFQLFSSWINNSRYDTQDFMLAADENVYSRFLLTAVRETPQGTLSGNKALACAPLQAFGGFLHHSYREHDYVLGRRNCQRMLEKWFVLHRENELFTDSIPGDYRINQTHLPIIPLYGSAHPEQLAAPWPEKEPLVTWPSRLCEPTPIAEHIEKRLANLLSQAISPLALLTKLKLIGGLLLPRSMFLYALRKLGMSKIIPQIRKALETANLSKPWWRS